MRKRGLEVVVLLSFIVIPSAALADPITGTTGPVATAPTASDSEPRSEERDRRSTSNAFATALFDLSGLQLLQIGAPQFVSLQPRALQGAAPQLVSDDAVVGLTSGTTASAVPNVSFTHGSDNVVVQGNNGVLTGNVNIPEPATLLLLAPGIALAWRRWRHGTRALKSV